MEEDSLDLQNIYTMILSKEGSIYSMRYLVINGSPHKGNTWRLVEYAVSYVREHDKSAEFKEFQLMDLNLPFCTGCSNCFRKGMEFCPHYEKVGIIYNALEWADGLILCSTTFNVRETALLKNLIDHFCYLMHRPHFFTKKALFITSVGGVGAKGAVKSIDGSLRAIGFNRCYSYKVRTVSWNAYNPNEKVQRQLSKVSEKFCKDVMEKKMHCPKSNILIPYNLFRGMCRYYAPGTEYESTDGVYWTDKERMTRAYDKAVPLHLYQRVLGGIFCFIGKTAGKKMIVTYKK
ncbi:NADPH-dependent FMN reductase [Anaerosporobacter mobilis DSM 15930]|uniref:NADPH-dependent FMN reductase n=2 Tax=Anaerosporobacter TaxID=653683 RepID=A0A1M7G7R5_9FIRM|nr:NADPH-dependent FMN reductase [Anaerosporobacter mobilis DSM 15930]